jgi:NADH dehydrogenase FAD-containing subunit
MDGHSAANAATPGRVVLGVGFGGLETAFYLRMLTGKRTQITLVSNRKSFLFKPNSIYVPFGLNSEKLRVPLATPAANRRPHASGRQRPGLESLVPCATSRSQPCS